MFIKKSILTVKKKRFTVTWSKRLLQLYNLVLPTCFFEFFLRSQTHTVLFWTCHFVVGETLVLNAQRVLFRQQKLEVESLPNSRCTIGDNHVNLGAQPLVKSRRRGHQLMKQIRTCELEISGIPGADRRERCLRNNAPRSGRRWTRRVYI